MSTTIADPFEASLDATSELWQRLSRPFDTAATVDALLGLSPEVVEQLVGVLVATCDEAEALLSGMPRTLRNLKTAIGSSTVAGADDTNGWEPVAVIRLRDDAVYVGLTNPYIEDKMVRINSRFRKDGKSDLSPYPGVDHVTALPTDVLIVREAGKTLVLHYGQMWRMQLYFWDSGYRAFTANVGVPGAIAKSIKAAVIGEG